MENDFDAMLQDRLVEAKQIEKAKVTDFLEDKWKNFRKGKSADFHQSPSTSIEKSFLIDLAKKLNKLPEGKKYFRKIVKLFKDRIDMLENDRLDWAMGELLAYASLLEEGFPIRISGQDVERGTFSHRHAVVKTEDDDIILTLSPTTTPNSIARCFPIIIVPFTKSDIFPSIILSLKKPNSLIFSGSIPLIKTPFADSFIIITASPL